jgi:hypothetical protein
MHRATSTRRGKSKERGMRTHVGSSMGSKAEDAQQEKAAVETILEHSSPKDRLEDEKKKLEKAQRTHERMLKKLEEATARTATREARFRLKVTDARFLLISRNESFKTQKRSWRVNMRSYQKR